MEAATVAARGLPGRFYAAFVPRASYLERMVALDRHGRAVGEAAGQGDLAQELLGGYPPTGPVTVAGRATTRAGQGVEMVVWPVRDGFCLSTAMVKVPAKAGGEQLGRAFFLAEVPSNRPLGAVRITALDAGGTAVGTWRRDGCG